MRAKTLTAILVALLLTRLLPIWQPVAAAMAATANKVTTGANSVANYNLGALTLTTTGNLVVVCVVAERGGGPAPTLLVTSSGDTWTNVGVSGTDPKWASMSWTILAAGGTKTININGNGANSYAFFGSAMEFSGQHATPTSGTSVGSSATNATMDTTAMTPADNNVLVTACGGPASSGTITENVSPGDSGFTLIGEDESGTNSPGSFVYKIISGAPGTPRAAWTVTSSAWATRIASFKPSVAAASGPASFKSLLGVGK